MKILITSQLNNIFLLYYIKNIKVFTFQVKFQVKIHKYLDNN